MCFNPKDAKAEILDKAPMNCQGTCKGKKCPALMLYLEQVKEEKLTKNNHVQSVCTTMSSNKNTL